MSKERKIYTIARRVTYEEFANVEATSAAEAKRTLRADKEGPKRRTKWMVLGEPRPVPHIPGT